MVRLGGRIAEELVFGVISTGGQQRPHGRHRAGPQDGAGVGHERRGSAPWRGARRARCSSARTSCTPASTATRRPASSTRRSSASCASRRSAAARRCASTAPASTGGPGAARARDDRRRRGEAPHRRAAGTSEPAPTRASSQSTARSRWARQPLISVERHVGRRAGGASGAEGGGPRRGAWTLASTSRRLCPGDRLVRRTCGRSRRHRAGS